jgi:hypothetical protein
VTSLPGVQQQLFIKSQYIQKKAAESLRKDARQDVLRHIGKALVQVLKLLLVSISADISHQVSNGSLGVTDLLFNVEITQRLVDLLQL